jgi:hypothetical protein
MTDTQLFVDILPDTDPQPDQSPASDLVTATPRVTFQWPSDCLWPFSDGLCDTQT